MFLSLVYVMLFSLFSLVMSSCMPENGRTLVIKGDPTYVCVVVGEDQYRTLFIPKADEFTELIMESSFEDTRMGGNSEGSFVSVSSIDASSFLKKYSSKDGKFFSILTAIISVKEGIIQGITWDDGCSLCAEDSCRANTYISKDVLLTKENTGSGKSCFYTSEDCSKDPRSCDLVVYVGWTGTDKNGDFLTSAGKRFSQFQKYSVQSYLKAFKERISPI